MVFAAAGLSAEIDNDPCMNYPTDMENPGYSSNYQLWPPGVRCHYDTPDGQELVTKEGHPVEFFAILAAGLLLVFGRRSKLAIATAFMFGAGGLAGFSLGWVAIVPVGMWLGLLLALAASRSFLATGIAFVALVIGWLAQFFAEIPAIWVVLLLIIAILPQRAEGVSQTVLSH